MSEQARTRVALLCAAVLVAAAAVSSGGCTRANSENRKLVIAAPALEQSALIYVAEKRGYFSDNGLDVTIRDEVAGPPAIAALLEGDADVAEAAEFPVVRSILNGEDLKIVAVNDRLENDYVIARKSAGIEEPEDLRGKRVGLAKGSIVEFYLGRFLELHDLTLRNVKLVDLAPDEFVDSIVSGEVDAVIAWQPYVRDTQARTKNVVVWPAQNAQPAYSVLVCRGSWLSENGPTMESFVRALSQAEEYLRDHPDAAQGIVADRLGYDLSYLREVWPEHRFGMSLDFSLIAAMDDEAHWMIDQRMVDASSPPDFRESIFSDALRTVNPDAVGIGD